MRRFRSVSPLAMALIAWTTTPPAKCAPAPDPLAKAKASVGILYVDNHDGTASHGSCTAVGARQVMFCWHLKDGTAPKDMTIVIQGKTLHPEIMGVEDTFGIKILFLPKESPLAVWAQPDPAVTYLKGAAVTAIGYSGDTSQFESIVGEMTALMEYRPRGTNKAIPIIRISQVLKPGMHGGGAFDEKGNLVGLILGLAEGEKTGVVLPLTEDDTKTPK